MVATMLASLVLSSQETVDINRVYAKGEKLNYNIQADLVIEQRVGNLKTFLVEDFGLQYAFTAEVMAMKADGICDMRYKRPTTTEIQGETPNSPEKRKVTKTNLDMMLTVSPVNEILKVEDLTPKKAKVFGQEPPSVGGWRHACPDADHASASHAHHASASEANYASILPRMEA
ncbi:MAG: hypothetical protein K1X67_25260, partial [Fimbriimonadaceae bacterium]|nr:hypothetical protein [Fimbriimonadaceae bacterium]